MERRAITVRGVVQGVGFRPFVHELAVRSQLGGFVRNDGGAVLIEVEGAAESLNEFLSDLSRKPPSLARVDEVDWRSRPARGETAFRIEVSEIDSAEGVSIAPDAATCAECLAELFDPADRRYRYPFLNCTHCGPRLTIIRGAPYDRERTTMAAFAMCADCRSEYEDPRNRRFHAQPTACPKCGPNLELRASSGAAIATDDPLAWFVRELRSGAIGALKGLGGFHLVCDAGNEAAVRELRRRKQRDEQPFAVMLPDLAAVQTYCELSEQEARLLQSAQAPIVLLKKRTAIERDGDVDGEDFVEHRSGRKKSEPQRSQRDAERIEQEAALFPLCAPLRSLRSKSSSSSICDAVALGNPYCGVMLPYSPLHHLLMRDLGGRGLVMTSGNRTSEPIAYENDEALARLARIADLFLIHDRPIHVRCDDSVTRVVAGSELPVRRSRGYAPRAIPLPFECPVPLLAVGGHLKGTFALARGRQAFLSHHLGDLEHFEAYRSFEREVALYQELFGIVPQCIVHDLHPDYAMTRWARQCAVETGVPLLAVQHHHAHIAACMAENGLDEPVIGVSFDGTGYGLDERTGEAAIWGGEFLVGDYRRFHRAAHLRYVGLPGGDSAVREPWRMALAQLLDAGCGTSILDERLPPVARRTIASMIERRFNTPPTSSAGRLFDAIASLIGLRDRTTYEGQAAAELEWLATGIDTDFAYPFAIEPKSVEEISSRPAANDFSRRTDSTSTQKTLWTTDVTERTDVTNNPRTESSVSSVPSVVKFPFDSIGGPLSISTDIVDTRPIIRSINEDMMRGVDAARIARRFHSTIVRVVETTCRRVRKRTGLDAVVLSGGVFANALIMSEVIPRLSSRGFRVYQHRLVPPNDGGLCLGQAAIAAATLRAESPEGNWAIDCSNGARRESLAQSSNVAVTL